MDMIRYERFEDWMNLLNAGDKTTKIYADIIHIKPSETLRSINVVLQLIKEGFVHSYFISEDMPYVSIVPAGVFEVLSSERLRKEAWDDYNHTLDDYDARVKGEYEKDVAIIKQLGYQNIIMGRVL